MQISESNKIIIYRENQLKYFIKILINLYNLSG